MHKYACIKSLLSLTHTMHNWHDYWRTLLLPCASLSLVFWIEKQVTSPSSRASEARAWLIRERLHHHVMLFSSCLFSSDVLECDVTLSILFSSLCLSLHSNHLKFVDDGDVVPTFLVLCFVLNGVLFATPMRSEDVLDAFHSSFSK